MAKLSLRSDKIHVNANIFYIQVFIKYYDVSLCKLFSYIRKFI
jgi:hypothetical protein